MNIREAMDVLTRRISVNELAQALDMEIPADFQQLGQYVIMGQQASNAGRWKEAEDYQIAILAGLEKHHDIPGFSIFENVANFTLANTFRQQGKYREAMSILARVISISMDPEATVAIKEVHKEWIENSAQLGVLGSMISVIIGEMPEVTFAAAYTVFVDCAMSIQDMPYKQIEEVLEDGIRYMDDLGQPDWASGLHLMRGQIWSAYGREEDALKEAQIALASRRREPMYRGTQVWFALNDISDYQLELENYDEAIMSTQEVIDNDSAPSSAKRRSYGNLALAYTEKGDLVRAKELTSKYLAMALEPQNAFSVAKAHSILAHINLKEGDLAAAASSAATAWRTICRQSTPTPVIAMLRCAQVRMAQARQAIGIPVLAVVPESRRPTISNKDSEIVRRKIMSATKWITRAQNSVDNLFIPRGGGYPSIRRIEKLRSELNSLTLILS